MSSKTPKSDLSGSKNEGFRLSSVNLGRLPGQVVVYGVEGDEFSAGEGLTARVEAAIEPAARAILDDLERLTRKEEPCTNER